LAKAGYPVNVYEKNKDVGMRFNGDLQGLENWSEKTDVLEDLKRMNIKINFDCYPFSKLTVTNCVKSNEVNSKKPLFYLVKRNSFSGTLDYGLKKQALELGAKIHFNKSISNNEADIIATGSVFKEVPGVVKGIVFKTNLKDTAITIYNDELAYKGYSYFFSAKGYGCMCSVVIGKMDKINECFEKTKEFFTQEYNLNIISPKSVGGVGSFSLKNIFKKGNALYVGEAAGLQDFLWGFGMRYAITSGYLAAQSIISGGDYEKTTKSYFENKLKASAVNRYLWEKAAGIKNYSFLINCAGIVKNKLYSASDFNLARRMIYPVALSYLRRKYPKLRL